MSLADVYCRFNRARGMEVSYGGRGGVYPGPSFPSEKRPGYGPLFRGTSLRFSEVKWPEGTLSLYLEPI